MYSTPTQLTQAHNPQIRWWCNSFCGKTLFSYSVAQAMDYISHALLSGLQTQKEESPTEVTSKSWDNSGFQKSSNMSQPYGLEQVQEQDSRSPAPSGHTHRRRTSSMLKTKTSYRFALPPPTTKHHQRLHLRSRLVLQLQQTSQTSRPWPFLNVQLPSAHIPLFPARFPRFKKGKSHPGSDALVVAYGYVHQEPMALKDKKDREETVATILRSKSGFNRDQGALICMDNGSQWRGSRLSNGSYDFVMENGHGLKQVCRWVSKQKSVSHERAVDSSKSADSPHTTDFSFSFLDPALRRHAIIATLTSQGMDISDQYCNPPPLTSSNSGQSHYKESFRATPQIEDDVDTSTHIVDNDLRLLITASGIVVALAEGFWHLPGHDGRDTSLR